MTSGYIDRRAHIETKIERAEKHIRDLENAIKSFIKTNPYAVLGQQDAETGMYVYKLKIVRHPPLGWSAILGDAIHNLRSALDILVWQLILAEGNKPSRKNAFPVSSSPKGFESHLKEKVKGVSPQALELFKAAEPYKGGKHEGLWILNELDIRDKHRLLVPVFTQAGGVSINEMFDDLLGTDAFTRGGIVFINPADKGPMKDGDIVFSAPEKPDTDPQFRFHIAFGEGDIIEGQPIQPTLTQFLDLVKGILEPFGPLLSHHLTSL